LKDDATLEAQRVKPPRAKLMVRHAPPPSPSPVKTAVPPSSSEVKRAVVTAATPAVPSHSSPIGVVRPLPLPPPPNVVPVGAPLPPVSTLPPSSQPQPVAVVTRPAVPPSTPPLPVPVDEPIRDPFPGAPVRLNGSDTSNLYSWGQGKTGRLGHGDQQPLLYPTRIQSFRGRRLYQMVAGGMHSVAVDVDGNVYFWGTFHTPPEKKEDYSLGSGMGFGRGRGMMMDDGDDDGIHAPGGGRGGLAGRGGGHVLIGGTTMAAPHAAAAGPGSGPVGPVDGTDEPREGKTHPGSQLIPLLMDELSSMKLRVTQLAAGQGHTLLVTDLGELYSWGDGSSGQLGHRLFESCRTPKRVEPLRAAFIRSVAAGASHSLALDDTGKVWSWGQGKKGQLGTATWRSSHTPTHIGLYTALQNDRWMF
jgi:hypothetical protein